VTQEPGERIGAGGSAEVFAYGEGAVLKLFRPEYGFAADREAQRTQAVHAAGIPAPRVLDVVVVGGRRGLVLERSRDGRCWRRWSRGDAPPARLVP
jgi:hypothetical protein